MRQILLAAITIYQVLISGVLKQLFGFSRLCRYTPSCSEYTKQAIRQRGALRGGILGVKRFLRCQPFYPYGAY